MLENMHILLLIRPVTTTLWRVVVEEYPYLTNPPLSSLSFYGSFQEGAFVETQSFATSSELNKPKGQGNKGRKNTTTIFQKQGITRFLQCIHPSGIQHYCLPYFSLDYELSENLDRIDLWICDGFRGRHLGEDESRHLCHWKKSDSWISSWPYTSNVLCGHRSWWQGNLSHSFSLEFANPTWEEVLERCQSLVNIPLRILTRQNFRRSFWEAPIGHQIGISPKCMLQTN